LAVETTEQHLRLDRIARLGLTNPSHQRIWQSAGAEGMTGRNESQYLLKILLHFILEGYKSLKFSGQKKQFCSIQEGICVAILLPKKIKEE